MERIAGILIYAFILFIVPVGIAGADEYSLPDTGQTKCYDNDGNEITCPSPGQPLYGQDANYTNNATAYMDNGDGTITDLNTALVWQLGDSHNNIGRTWQQACDYCDGLDLGGKTDWRIPNRRELASLPLYGLFNPAIDPHFDCRSAVYWSGSARAESAGQAWSVDFMDGNLSYTSKDVLKYIRCVRGEPSAHTGFIDNGNNTVTDTVTGLVWQQRDDHNDGAGRTWEEALDYCECLNLAGYTDWRLPNVRELESLIDVNRSLPPIDPLFDCRLSFYWSSSTFAKYLDNALYFDFNSGRSYYNSKYNHHKVRCVRTPQSWSLPLDIGEVEIVLTPTTPGEEEYSYILECTYMGNNHYSLCGKATHSFPLISGKKDAAPVFTHTKVVYGNAEIADTQIVFYLQETYEAALDVIPPTLKELNYAAVRVVINISSLDDKNAVSEWIGTYTANETKYYVNTVMDETDKASTAFSEKFIEGSSIFRIHSAE